MKTTAHAVLLVSALGLAAGCGDSTETAPSAEISAGGESIEVALPLEAYVSPEHDFVSIDLAQLASHPLVEAWVESAISALEQSSLGRELGLGGVLRRTQKLLVVTSFDDAAALAREAAGWIFARGEYEGFSLSEPERGALFRRGDHTLIFSQRGDDVPTTVAGDEALDAAIALRVDVGDAARERLTGLPARATVETAERLRLRVSLGDVVAIDAALDHADEWSAQRSLDELRQMLARVRPLLLLSPKAIRTVVDKLALGVEGASVVARLELTAQDVRDLDELARKLGLDEALAAGVNARLDVRP